MFQVAPQVVEVLVRGSGSVIVNLTVMLLAVVEFLSAKEVLLGA